MKRTRKNTSNVTISTRAAEMVTTLAASTGFTHNFAASRLIELGTYYLTRTTKSAEAAAEALELAIKSQQIRQEAEQRIAALKNRIPRRVTPRA